MNNEIIISNIAPQDIKIEGGGSIIGLTDVYVNGVDVTVGSVAYVIVPTKLSELENNVGYITSETDPTVPTYIKQIRMSDITSWNNKQNLLVSGTNIKTINNNSILGSGNLDISTSYTAGTGIEITEENVINNTITSYNDLTDRPTIPTHTSDLINNSNFVNGNSLSQIAYTGDYEDIINKPDLSEYITKYVDNLVNYYTKDFMYGLLPKVSDEDTSITLNDTYPSDLKISLSPSELSQDGEPTPSTPYDIHTISGDNTIKVEGTQLFDIKSFITSRGGGYTENSDGSITITNNTGNLYSRPYVFSETDINVSLSGIISDITSSNVRVQLLNSNNEIVGEIKSSSSSALNKTASKIRFNWSTSGTYSLKNIMLNKGTTALPYEPHQEQTANVKLRSNNIAQPETSDYFEYINGLFKNTSTDIRDYFYAQIRMLYDTNGYHLAGTNTEATKNFGLSASSPLNQTYSLTFTTTATTKYIMIGHNGSQTNLFTNALAKVKPNTTYTASFNLIKNNPTILNGIEFNEIMLNEGSEALPYDEFYDYGEYCKIGNYKDQFYKATDSDTSLISGKWYLKKNIGKVVLDGSEVWNYSSGSSAFYTDIANLNYLTSNNVPICTHYKGKANVSGPGSLGNNEIAFYNDASPSRVYIKDTNYSDTTSYKSWLSSNNVIADYIRANPTYIPLNDTLQEQLEYIYNQMLSYQGQTSISQESNDLPFIISATTLKDISSL